MKLYCCEGRECKTNLCGGHGPDLEIVRAHEDVGNARPHRAQDPLVKRGRLLGRVGLEGGVDQSVEALELVGFLEDGDVVLERVWDPSSLEADVRDALVGVPVVLCGECLVDAVVEVLVVGEDDVSADVEELEVSVSRCIWGSVRRAEGRHVRSLQE